MVLYNKGGEPVEVIKHFLKGIIAGMGGIAPGLSGSVLLVIMGLYEKTVGALGTLFKHFKKNVKFLLPVCLGMICGVLIFSRIVDFLLANFETPTRFAFLGLVLGTIPLFYRQVRKKGFRSRYYFVMLVAGLTGLMLFGMNKAIFPQITDPNFFQKVLLGVAVAGSSIVPGVDSAVIMSSLGLYELYVSSIANLDMRVLLPALIGLVLGAAAISAGMNFLLKKAYTLTFSVIFGLFISIIPNILQDCYKINNLWEGAVAIAFALAGCIVSYYLGDISANNARLKRLFKKK
jgi:putative membrane protein